MGKMYEHDDEPHVIHFFELQYFQTNRYQATQYESLNVPSPPLSLRGAFKAFVLRWQNCLKTVEAENLSVISAEHLTAMMPCHDLIS